MPNEIKNIPSNLENKKKLIAEILRPLVFLDLFDFPPTAYEIRHYLDKKYSLLEVVEALDGALLEVISKKNGFYFLRDREDVVTTRKIRYNYSCQKIKIAKKFARIFSLLPFIKTIAVANFIGEHNLREEGDIDFFIITSAKRIWLSRLFCAGIAKLLNSRPTAKNKKNKICLSFYVSTAHLDLSDLKLGLDDPYFYYWLRGLLPIYDKANSYTQFLQANKLEFNNLKSDTQINYQAKKISVNNSPINLLEKIVKNWQLKIMSPALKAAMNNSDGVYITDSVLKLYLGDKRRLFADKFRFKYDEFIQKIN